MSAASLRVRDAGEEDIPALVEMILAEAREAEGRALDPAVVTAAVTTALRDTTLARTWLLCDRDERLGATSTATTSGRSAPTSGSGSSPGRT